MTPLVSHLKHRYRNCDPEPPSGPPSDAFSYEDGLPPKYMAWRVSNEGRRALAWMVFRGREHVAGGATRLSVNWLSDNLRAEMKIRHCNTWRPWIATDLCVRAPDLEPFIERKPRKKTEPPPIGVASTVRSCDAQR